MWNSIKYLLVAVFFKINSIVINADIIIDDSFGSAGVLQGPNFKITENLGRVVGNNLFHSFSEFSLQKGESVTFSAINKIENVIGRVSGSEISEIDGIISSDILGADLYLLNPNGFLFKENAEVNIDGAFVVSAMSKINLGETGEFNAVDPQKSVFVTAPPDAFGFLENNPAGKITLKGSSLVTTREINLIANDLILTNSHLVTDVNNVNEPDINIEILNSLKIDENSYIGTKTQTDKNSGNIKISTPKLILAGNSPSNQNSPNQNPKGPPGKPDNEKKSLFASGSISTFTISDGIAGAIELSVNEFSMNGGTLKSFSLPANKNVSTGESGDIYIKADTIDLNSKAMMDNVTNGSANSGSINIKADTLLIDEDSIISTRTNSSNEGGDAGNILIESNHVSVGSGGSIISISSGDGDAGVVGIKSESISINSTGNKLSNIGSVTKSKKLNSQKPGKGNGFTRPGGKKPRPEIFKNSKFGKEIEQGDAGMVLIETDELLMKGGSLISTDTSGNGDAGSVRIKSGKTIINGELDRSLISSSSFSTGKAGNLTIESHALTVKNGGLISVDAFEAGNAGLISIMGEDVRIENNGKLSAVTKGKGEGGGISINSKKININNGIVLSSSVGEGIGGEIKINSEILTIDKNSSLSTESEKSNGGDIQIYSDGSINISKSLLSSSAAKNGGIIELLGTSDVMIKDSKINAEAGNDGGNLHINQPSLFVLNRASLNANAVNGQGGNIYIHTVGFLASSESKISVSSEFGLEGKINLKTPDTNVGSDLIILPDKLSNKHISLSDRCGLGINDDQSSFFLNGNGGLSIWSSEVYLSTLEEISIKK